MTTQDDSLQGADIDEIMLRIRQEVARGSDEESEGVSSLISSDAGTKSGKGSPSSPTSQDHLPEIKDAYHVSDFLGFDDEEFLENAYLRILGRGLDESGREIFLDRLRSKQLSKVELLARLRYSAEGRSKRVPIRGSLLARGLFQRAFRIPVLGYLLSSTNYLAKLPVLARNLDTVQSDLRLERRRHQDLLNAARDQLFAKLGEKVDKEAFWKASNEKIDKNVFWKTTNEKVDKEVYDQNEGQRSRNYWRALNNKVDKETFERRQAELGQALADVQSSQEQLLRRFQDQKVTLLDQQRRLGLLLEEARKRMPEPFSREQLGAIAAAGDHWLDAYYLSFEDVFRGTREDIKQRAEVYLPTIRAAGAGTDERPVIDVGCGRGELLELLKGNGLVARGVDQNQILIKQCRDSGFEVIEADAIDYLQSLSASSVGAITGLHIIEHIPFERLVRLFDECRRVLKPAGVVAFETPNPENLIVGACNFYYDPTHLHPLPPPVSKFLLEARGFVSVETKMLSEHRAVEMLPRASADEPETQPLNRVVDFINEHFAAAPDYAVIGYKA
jgi:O-antigen chain-terminating methyltransferase